MRQLLRLLSVKTNDYSKVTEFTPMWFEENYRVKAMTELLLTPREKKTLVYRCNNVAYAVHSCVAKKDAEVFYAKFWSERV